MMSFFRRTALAVAVLVLLGPGSGWSGPIADFEAEMKAAYADYRAALFQTNRNDKAATEAALNGFLTKWRTIAVRWSATPPPHMMEDREVAGTFARIEEIALTAQKEASAGALAEAHETLEAIRDEIGALRQRNGLITFSDRMNAYHEKMEVVLGRQNSPLDAAMLGTLREEAAVLNYLVETISQHVPADLKTNSDFAAALDGLRKSVLDLVDAARGGDPAAAKKALQALKGPYSRMFLRFG
jgi:hypothetical protein